jgi:hypothetical protein
MCPLPFFTNACYRIHGTHRPLHSFMAKYMDMGPLFDSGQKPHNINLQHCFEFLVMGQ